MESFSINGVVQAEYKYNYLGQQAIRTLTQTGQVINSVYGPDGNRIAEFEYDPVAGSSSLLREYVWFEGKPVAVVEGGVVYFVRSDNIGKPVFATDGTGAKVWEATYLPFGGVHTSSGLRARIRGGMWTREVSKLMALKFPLFQSVPYLSNMQIVCYQARGTILGIIILHHTIPKYIFRGRFAGVVLIVMGSMLKDPCQGR